MIPFAEFVVYSGARLLRINVIQRLVLEVYEECVKQEEHSLSFFFLPISGCYRLVSTEIK